MLASARGVGITQTMDLLAARELVDGNLTIILSEHTQPGPPLSIVHTPAAQRLARVRVVSDFLRELCEYVVQRAAAHTGLKPVP
jgi:DNA-binding transcriptional LysR family regulator